MCYHIYRVLSQVLHTLYRNMQGFGVENIIKVYFYNTTLQEIEL